MSTKTSTPTKTPEPQLTKRVAQLTRETLETKVDISILSLYVSCIVPDESNLMPL